MSYIPKTVGQWDWKNSKDELPTKEQAEYGMFLIRSYASYYLICRYEAFHNIWLEYEKKQRWISTREHVDWIEIDTIDGREAAEEERKREAKEKENE